MPKKRHATPTILQRCVYSTAESPPCIVPLYQSPPHVVALYPSPNDRKKKRNAASAKLSRTRKQKQAAANELLLCTLQCKVKEDALLLQTLQCMVNELLCHNVVHGTCDGNTCNNMTIDDEFGRAFPSIQEGEDGGWPICERDIWQAHMTFCEISSTLPDECDCPLSDEIVTSICPDCAYGIGVSLLA